MKKILLTKKKSENFSKKEKKNYKKEWGKNWTELHKSHVLIVL